MSFAAEGFAIHRGALSPKQIDQARALVAQLVRRFRAGDPAVLAASVGVADITTSRPERNPGVDAAQTLSEPFIIGDLVALDTRFAALIATEALWQCAREALRCSMHDVVFHFSNITRKPARCGPALAWHRDADNTYFAPADRQLVRVLVPLDEMSSANGGTQLVAGSHLDAALTCETGRVITPELRAGDGLILHAETLHGGAPNRSGLDRSLLVVQFGLRACTKFVHRNDERMSLASHAQLLHRVRDLEEDRLVRRSHHGIARAR
jgi:ectoine hydroxylase-related dioxygenase (phytanoyl-CoA dioxygenase family)